MARLISSDVGLSAAILYIVNSPLYGLSRSVSDINKAVVFLGWEGVKSIVLSVKIKSAFSKYNSCLDLGRFWDTASDVATVAALLGSRFKSITTPESLYVVGLFHDCGIPPMAIRYSCYKDTLNMSNSGNHGLGVDLENERYSTNHAVIGYYIASAWKLPKDICHVILRHHDFTYLDVIDGSKEQFTFAILKLAEHLVNVDKRGESSPDWKYIEKRIFNVLGISNDELLDLYEDISDFLRDW